MWQWSFFKEVNEKNYRDKDYAHGKVDVNVDYFFFPQCATTLYFSENCFPLKKITATPQKINKLLKDADRLTNNG